MTHQAKLLHFIHFCEHLSADNIGEFARLYSADAFFKDPFNEVKGHAAIIRIFDHMFTQLDQPKFVVTQHMLQGDEAFLTWDFMFFFKGDTRTQQCIHGATHLKFSADHTINYHRDYWDAAEELYEKIPLLGGFMRLLKRMANK